MTHNIMVERDVMVTMRDGVKLASDIYRPDDGVEHPVLVNQHPYDNDMFLVVHELLFSPLVAAQKGYVVVSTETRGRSGSEGEWRPYGDEGKDAYDARKISLPGITPAGQFSHRRAADLNQHSGLVPIDFDDLEPAEAIAARDLAGTSPHCVLAFISPSERGIKALVRVQLDSGAEIDSATHHAAWVRASKHLAEAQASALFLGATARA